MELILDILYFYLILYTLYLFVLGIRNLNDKPFSRERKYSKYDEYKRNFAVIVYSHNHRACLEELIEKLKMQDYPLANFKVYAVLDDCNDGSEKIFENDKFVYVLNIQDHGTLGKTKAVTMLLDRLKTDETVDAYVFIDGTRKVESDFFNPCKCCIE